MGDAGPVELAAPAAVARLSAALDEEVELVGSLTGGETGATEIRRRDGRRAVLKWELDPSIQRSRREGARLAERLRVEAGWPAPRQEVIDADGCLFVVQELMAGSTVTHLSHALVDTLFDLHEARLGLAPADGSGSRWADAMVEVLVAGGNGYCLHRPLRDFDGRTRRLVERIEEIGRSLEPDDLVGSDIVHGDLHPGNLLQAGGRLTAVVDLDFTQAGDATFDLTMLAVSSLGVGVDPGVRSRLFDLGVHALPDAARQAYVANLLLRNLDWAIRKGRSAEVELWLVEADRLLPPDGASKAAR